MKIIVHCYEVNDKQVQRPNHEFFTEYNHVVRVMHR